VRALITGIGGFVGQHLAAHLLQQGDTVIGIARDPVEWGRDQPGSQVELIQADILSARDTEQAVAHAAPEHVYLLAGLSSVQPSFAEPLAFVQHNIACLINTLEAVRAHAPEARLLVVSSSEIYGSGTGQALTDETAELRPENPYAASKAAQDLLGYTYALAHQLYVIRVRPFNHIGPGQSEHFVASSFAKQVTEIELGRKPPVISVGNLAMQRDFTDVRDMVRAYRLALLKCEPGTPYNVGTGIPVPIQRLLDGLVARSRTPVTITVDKARLRPSDPPGIICDASRFRRMTGWAPEIPIESTLDDILEDWRDRLRNENGDG